MCLSFILYYRNFYIKDVQHKKDMLMELNDLFENIDSFYGNDDAGTINTKVPIMAEKHWLFRYFIYSLITQDIVKKQDLNEVLEEQSISSGMTSNGLFKTRLNPEFMLKSNRSKNNENILNFYSYLLQNNVHFVSRGKDDKFRFL